MFWILFCSIIPQLIFKNKIFESRRITFFVLKVRVEPHCLLDATSQLPGHKKSLLKGKPFLAFESTVVEKIKSCVAKTENTYKCLKTQT